jgi:hypothetical protein
MTPSDRRAVALIGVHIALARDERDEDLRIAAIDGALERIKRLLRRRPKRVRSGRFQLVDMPRGRGIELSADEVAMIMVALEDKAKEHEPGSLAREYWELLDKMRGI